MSLFSVILVFLSATSLTLGLTITEENCEVCVKYLTSFVNSLSEPTKKSVPEIENAFKEFCKTSKGKDNRFCYYIGGMPDSATYILAEMAKPISWSMPVEKVCEKLQKKDSQVCELRYERQIDLTTVDLKKLKVRDLKKILDDWGEVCDGCLEKGDFIKMIEELKPAHIKSEL